MTKGEVSIDGKAAFTICEKMRFLLDCLTVSIFFLLAIQDQAGMWKRRDFTTTDSLSFPVLPRESCDYYIIELGTTSLLSIEINSNKNYLRRLGPG